LLRAAAKNHERVSVLSDPADYADFVKAWTEGKGDVGAAVRSRLALKAFEMTARYDEAISGYFREQYADAADGEKRAGPPQRLALRYGANPHQKPAQAFVTDGELPFKGVIGFVLIVTCHFICPDASIYVQQFCSALLVISTSSTR